MQTLTRKKIGIFKSPLANQKVVSRYHLQGHVNNILGHSKSIKALTLPESNFIFERLLMRDPDIGSKVQLECFEFKADTYSRGLSNIPGGRINYTKADAFSYLASTKSKFNFIWLDMCSSMSKKLEDRLKEVMTGPAIAENCLFCFTVSRARQYDPMYLKGKFGTIGEYMKKGLPMRLKLVSTSVNRTCNLLDVYEYKSSVNPMSIYVFHIKSNKTNYHGESKQSSQQGLASKACSTLFGWKDQQGNSSFGRQERGFSLPEEKTADKSWGSEIGW